MGGGWKGDRECRGTECFSMSVFRFQIGLTVINVVQSRYMNLDPHPDFIQSRSHGQHGDEIPNSY